MATLEQVRAKATEFLAIADELNEKVSAYIDGSDASEDENAYIKVKELSIEFGKIYCEYYDEPFCNDLREGFNYELAEAII